MAFRTGSLVLTVFRAVFTLALAWTVTGINTAVFCRSAFVFLYLYSHIDIVQMNLQLLLLSAGMK